MGRILSQSEFEAARDEVLRTFAEASGHDMERTVWRFPAAHGTGKTDRNLLWLFTFALSTYDHAEGAINFITEQQVMSLFAKVNSF